MSKMKSMNIGRKPGRPSKEKPTTDVVEKAVVESAPSVGSSSEMASKFGSVNIEQSKTDGKVKITNMTMGRIDVRGTTDISCINLLPGETKDIPRTLYRDLMKNEMTRIWLDIGVLKTDYRPEDEKLMEATSNPVAPDSLKVGICGEKEAREDLSRRSVGTVTI